MMMCGKILTWLLSPLAIGLAGLIVSCWAAGRGRKRRAVCMGALTLVWFAVWASPIFYCWFGYSLERLYPPARVETTPGAEAIVLLGGGMCSPGRTAPYPDMTGAADRVWQAARLYHAGKAPLVISSGCSEEDSSVVLLRDLGVPASAIRVEGASRNTAENARFSRQMLASLGIRRVILVTSAWHMRRAVWLFRHAGVDVIPSASDYEATLQRERLDRWSLYEMLPTPAMLDRNTCCLKEVIGYWVCRITGRLT